MQCRIAIELARQLKRPVQVTLSQSESQNHDRAAPGALARMTALPGEGGITAAWQMRVATADGLGSALARARQRANPTNSASTALDGAVPPYAIPHVRGRSDARAICPSQPATCAARRSASSPSSPKASSTSWRAPPGWSRWPSECRCSGRTAGSRAACRARRGSRMGRRRRRQHDGARRLLGLRLAHRPGGDAQASATTSGSRSHRLVAAVDCGRDRQFGAGQAAGRKRADLGAGAGDRRRRPNGSPECRARGRLAESACRESATRRRSSSSWSRAATPPGGINGLGTTVLAPAVANAIYAGTGKRMRSLPFDPMAAA